MGHYRGEMVSDEEREEEERRKQERRNRIAKNIRATIDEEGIEYVLVDILENPTTATIRFNRE